MLFDRIETNYGHTPNGRVNLDHPLFSEIKSLQFCKVAFDKALETTKELLNEIRDTSIIGLEKLIKEQLGAYL